MRKHPKAFPIAFLLAGGAIFAGGVFAASRRLPEWRAGKLPPRSFFESRARDLAAKAGLKPASQRPTTYLVSERDEDEFLEINQTLGMDAGDWLTATGRGISVQVFRRAVLPGGAPAGFHVRFALDGRPWSVGWRPVDFSVLMKGTKLPEPAEALSRVTPLLLLPGESLGPPEEIGTFGGVWTMYPVVGSRPPQRLGIGFPSGYMEGSRQAGTVQRARRDTEEELGTFWWRFVLYVLFFLVALVLFFTLAVKRRLGVKNGLILALLFLGVALGNRGTGYAGTIGLVNFGFAVFFAALLLFFLWAGSESWMRSRDPAFTTSLDALRSGRLGPRGGRALLAGSAVGAGLAGLRLGFMTVAASASDLAPKEGSVPLPLFSFSGDFLGAFLPAAMVLFALAAVSNILPSRWVPYTATALAALLLALKIPVTPFPFALVMALAVAALLVFAFRRFGLAALLTASVMSYLLAAAVFSVKHFDWLKGSFFAGGGASALILLLGFVGLSRAPLVEARRLAPPAFVRRLEEERRLKYEMDLLARMQVGLLPGRPPEVPGYEIAARSILATEVGGDLYDFIEDEKGRLWIAAGDVSGHGYSCSIAQAMTKAALVSLVTADRTPSEVLRRVDRVLRKGEFPRTFTSMALLQLDPATGKAWMSNAGHPYALLAADGKISEIPLPSLPLGQGPGREYADQAFEIAPGGVLIFLSDGLIEGVNSDDQLYGYDRPREILKSLLRRPAGAILEALLADWREHVGPGAPADDTTLVVLKRTMRA